MARSLTGFAGVGTAAVGALIVTGLINSVYLVGVSKALSLTASSYGVLLMIKLALFGLMVCLAAANRFRLAPLMACDAGQAMPHLKKSLAIEFAMALAILAVVAVMGVQPPPLPSRRRAWVVTRSFATPPLGVGCHYRNHARSTRSFPREDASPRV